jgi:arylsulfatase A-like enzyme
MAELILPECGGGVRATAWCEHSGRSALVLVFLLAWVGCGPDLRPNVLVVSIDTLRADHLAAYGYERETAPTLTRLAEEGALFTNSYSQSSSTVPTHASLFTGRYPFQHGSYHVGLGVGDEESTLAERFAELGYRTFAATSSVRFRGPTGFDQGFQHFARFDELEKNDRSAAVTDRVLAWLGEADGPWFGFVHYFDPHQPYAPPEPFRSQWHEGLARPQPEGTSDYLYFHDGPEKEVPADVLEYLRALYDGEILFLDGQLERLIGAVAPAPGSPGTLVVITSDHGEEFKEHGGLSHSRRLHEELVRVPLLAWWPGRIPAGTVVDDPVQTVDVLPTVLELVGAEPGGELPGRSRAGSLVEQGREQSSSPPLHAGNPVLAQIKSSRWAISADVAGSRFKYVSRDDAPHRLFDLASDPGGHRDLLYDRPEVVTELRALAVELGVAGVPTGAAAATEVSPEIRERLREIGYLEEAEGSLEEAEGSEPSD